MSPQDDIERRLTRFGKQLRTESDLADRVRARLEATASNESSGVLSWFGDMTMRQRITFGSIGAAAAILAVFLIAFPAEKVGFAQAIEKVREAKSYSYEWTMTPTKQEIQGAARGKAYWQASKTSRMEFTRSGTEEQSGSGEIDQVMIAFADKPGIEIDHRAKTYRTLPARRGEQLPVTLLYKLGQYSGEAKRELGRKEIAGAVSEGYEIDIRKIDPNVPSGSVELWIDVETQLPTQIDIQQGEMPVVMRMENFKWNETFPAGLFDVTPPEDYADKTRAEESVDEQVSEIQEAMKLYAELSGGHYPKVRRVYGDVMRDELLKMAGIAMPPTPEQYRGPRYREIQQATFGLARMTVIQRDNEDAAFFGIDVGPEDADKVLFRWKLPDGRYQVMYGDLRSEAITADRLKELERP